MIRKLDALVAERIFAWSIERSQDDQQTPTDRGWPGNIHPAIKAQEIPQYSTDIAAAWEVVEKLRLKFRIPSIEISQLGGSDKWFFRMNWPQGVDRIGTVALQAMTVQMVICLAALKVYGVSESEIDEAMK